MTRHAKAEEVIAILRALAVLHERGTAGLLVTEASRAHLMPGSPRAVLQFEYDASEFYRVVGGLRVAGVINTERLFNRHLGPGEVTNVAQDGAIELLDTLARCAEAGQQVEIIHPHPHAPREGDGENEVLTFTVRVKAKAFYGLRPHQF